MFFDIHTHAFHPKIAHKAVDHLNTVYHLDCRGDGTIEHLLEREKAAGIDRCIVLCAATAPAQVIPANNYAMKLQREHEEVIGFGTLHPAYVDWEDELERMKAGGLRGIKLHPDFQGFALNDRRLLPIFESARTISSSRSISAATIPWTRPLPAPSCWPTSCAPSRACGSSVPISAAIRCGITAWRPWATLRTSG